MENSVFLWSICLIPFLLLAPKKLKSKLSFLIVVVIGAITSSWAFTTFLNGPVHIFFLDAPIIGNLSIDVDHLSALFILIINVVSIAASIYAIGYMKRYENTPSLNLNFISFNLLHLSMLMVCSLQNIFAFLIIWEIMSLSSFLLVIFDYKKKETLKAGLNYLVQMHVGVVLLMIGFMMVYKSTGMLSFEAIGFHFSSTVISTDEKLLLFLIFFAGFGIKAGFVPLHTWLPHAHPAAPSHVSAVMSGVMIKMGIYGIFRIISLLNSENHLTAGMILLLVGIITGLYGIINSIMQKDLKKMLAYSSIENIGIIGIGIGMGVLGLGVKDHAMAFLGFAGALLHVINHSLFKSLLFFCAGSVYQQTHTKDTEKLGGLIKKMPVTGMLFLAGSISICALPPFNGFVSEFLLYNGLIEGMKATNVRMEVFLLIALISLSLIGGLAIYAFTKIFGLSFLGSPRSMETEHAKEPTVFMLIPQYLIAVSLLIAGTFPQFFFRMASKPISLFIPDYNGFKEDSLSSLNNLSIALLVFIGLGTLIYLIRNYFVKKNKTSLGATWGCGYVSPNTRMQYTPSSYANYFTTFARPLVKTDATYTAFQKTEIFPANRSFETSVEDVVEQRFVLKAVNFIKKKFNIFAVIQTGETQFYILYAFVFIVAMFLITFFTNWLS